MHVSDLDMLITRDNYHDWVLANERMAKVMADKGYPCQFVFVKTLDIAIAACRRKPCRWRWNMFGRGIRKSDGSSGEYVANEMSIESKWPAD